MQKINLLPPQPVSEYSRIKTTQTDVGKNSAELSTKPIFERMVRDLLKDNQALVDLTNRIKQCKDPSVYVQAWFQYCLINVSTKSTKPLEDDSIAFKTLREYSDYYNKPHWSEHEISIMVRQFNCILKELLKVEDVEIKPEDFKAIQDHYKQNLDFYDYGDALLKTADKSKTTRLNKLSKRTENMKSVYYKTSPEIPKGGSCSAAQAIKDESVRLREDAKILLDTLKTLRSDNNLFNSYKNLYEIQKEKFTNLVTKKTKLVEKITIEVKTLKEELEKKGSVSSVQEIELRALHKSELEKTISYLQSRIEETDKVLSSYRKKLIGVAELINPHVEIDKPFYTMQYTHWGYYTNLLPDFLPDITHSSDENSQASSGNPNVNSITNKTDPVASREESTVQAPLDYKVAISKLSEEDLQLVKLKERITCYLDAVGRSRGKPDDSVMKGFCETFKKTVESYKSYHDKSSKYKETIEEFRKNYDNSKWDKQQIGVMVQEINDILKLFFHKETCKISAEHIQTIEKNFRDSRNKLNFGSALLDQLLYWSNKRSSEVGNLVLKYEKAEGTSSAKEPIPEGEIYKTINSYLVKIATKKEEAKLFLEAFKSIDSRNQSKDYFLKIFNKQLDDHEEEFSNLEQTFKDVDREIVRLKSENSESKANNRKIYFLEANMELIRQRLNDTEYYFNSIGPLLEKRDWEVTRKYTFVPTTTTFISSLQRESISYVLPYPGSSNAVKKEEVEGASQT